MVVNPADTYHHSIWHHDTFRPNFSRILVRLHVVLTKIKKLFLVAFSLVFLVLSIIGCYFVAQKFFFDKFFYQKSIAFGYGMFMNQNLTLKSFGKRGSDLNTLLSSPNQTLNNPNAKQNYTVAVIGDSFSWGLGVKYNNTVSQILNRKLNQTRNTKVYNFSQPGDSILDYFAHAKMANTVYPVDLFVVLMVSNDLALNKDNRLPNNDYQDIIYNCQLKNPQSSIKYWLDWQKFISDNPTYTQQKVIDTIQSNVVNSWSSPSNLCVLNKIASEFPPNTIFLITDDYQPNENSNFYQIYQSTLQKYNHIIISSRDQKDNLVYASYWQNPDKYFHVSRLEYHPSVLAHQMYSDRIYKEIIENKKWNFLK